VRAIALLACVSGCAEPEATFSLQFALQHEGVNEWHLLGLEVGDEAVVCNASGGLVEGLETGENRRVNQPFPAVAGKPTTIEANVVGGFRYVFRVRGRQVPGDDTTTVTQGCGDLAVSAGQTETITITLHPVLEEAICPDGDRQANEQCDDGNDTPGDGCAADCTTEDMQLNTALAGSQQQPTIGAGDAFVIAFRGGASGTSIVYRTFGPLGETRGVAGWRNDLPLAGAQAVGPITYQHPGIGMGGSRFVVAYEKVFIVGGGAEHDILFTACEWGAEQDFCDAGLAGVGAHVEEDSIEQEEPAAAVQEADGSFAVAWIEVGDVVVSTFGPDGSADGGPEVVSDAPGATNVSIAALSDGNYVAGWDRAGARFRFVAQDATAPGDEVVAAAGTASQVSVGTNAAADRFAVVWADGGDVFFQSFDLAGASDAAAVPVSAALGDSLPSVDGNAGHWYVVWQADGDVWGRYVNDDGSFARGPMGLGEDDAFRVNQLTDDTQAAPVIGMNANVALAAWADSGVREDVDNGIRFRALTEPAF